MKTPPWVVGMEEKMKKRREDRKLKFIKRAALTGMLVLFASLFTGCSDKSAEEILNDALSDQTVSPADETAADAPEDDTEQNDAEAAETEKYNSYINVNNFMTDRLQTVIDSYFRAVKFQKKFELADGESSYWCNSLGDSYYEILDEAHEYASKDPAYKGLDEAFEAMYPVLREMMEAFDGVYEYSDTKNYKDDDFKQAREYHKVIWKDYKEFEDLADIFFNELGEIADKQKREDLAMYQEEGYMAHYTFMSALLKAQEIQSAIYDQKVGDENLMELNIKKLQPLYKEFTELVKESLTYLKDEEQMEQEYGTGADGYMLESALKDTKVALTDLFERVKEKDELEAYERNSSFPADGTISNFEDKLGELIRYYNQM